MVISGLSLASGRARAMVRSYVRWWYFSSLMPMDETPMQKKPALYPFSCSSMAVKSEKSVWIISLSFGCCTPHGRRLITTGTSPKDLVKFWDVETIRDLVALPGEPGLFSHHIGFSPDGNTLFADSIDGIALLWRAPSWAEIEAAENKKNGP